MLEIKPRTGSVTCDQCKKTVDIDRAKTTRSRWIRVVPFAREPARMIARTSVVERDFCSDECLIDFCLKHADRHLKGRSEPCPSPTSETE